MNFSIFEKKIYCAINQIKVSKKKLISYNFVSDPDQDAKYYIASARSHIHPLDIIIEGRYCKAGHLLDTAMILNISEAAICNFYYGMNGRGLYSNNHADYYNFGVSVRTKHL